MADEPITPLQVDAVNIVLTPWGCQLAFGHRAYPDGVGGHVAIPIRLPLVVAKTMALQVLRAVRQYEHQSGCKVDLPQPILDELKIPREDWNTFMGGGAITT